MFAGIPHDTLLLFHADALEGPWREHPRSPILSGDASRARPGGRVTREAHRLIRFGQDCVESYGRALRAFEVTSLSASEFTEQELPESPVLTASGRRWNANGMHHADPHQLESGHWLACVDGSGRTWQLGWTS
jgi:hypothetical protein